MILGRICGAVYSTINHPFYDNRRLLLIDRLDPAGQATGKYLIAVDSVGAGSGETVLIVDEGNSARQIVGDAKAPIRSIIVGIVDEVSVVPRKQKPGLEEHKHSS
ncbi:ethanolamine utilization protein EutN [bacterium BMS3Abin05]|nr:ethanolamine utilization protein EutN [bacterium BMS3Abin05]